jgi:trans-aconitate methyltransferase
VSYAERVADELERYRDVENVHDLPAIYRSGGHVDPLLRQLGYASLDQFLLEPVVERCGANEHVSIVSLGSGNGELELGLARLLQGAGHDNFHIRRLELNAAMRERAHDDAVAAGLGDHLIDEAADLNVWEPAEQHDVVLANHSLHHVCELERLFEQVRAGGSPDSVFIVNDMIGRNGHMRWPEALELVQSIWAAMPDRYGGL